MSRKEEVIDKLKGALLVIVFILGPLIAAVVFNDGSGPLNDFDYIRK